MILQETIVRVKEGFRIIGHRSGKNLGTFKTRAQAKRRLAQLARFRESQDLLEFNSHQEALLRPQATLSEAPDDVDPDNPFEAPDRPFVRPAQFTDPFPALSRNFFNRIPETQVGTFLATPLGGARYAQSFVDLGTSLLTRLRNILTTGLIQGQGVTKVAKSVQDALGNAKYQAERIVRSEFVRTAAIADQQIYGANQEHLDGVQWSATLDDKTCLQCGELDGEIFAVDEAPTPVDDTHPMCRCRLVPVVKNGEDLGFGPASRASMNGQVPATQTYEDWFADQDEATQEEILGPTRFRLYSSGQAQLGDFVTAHGVKSVKDVLRDFGRSTHYDSNLGEAELIEFNPRHEPAGSPIGGQFAGGGDEPEWEEVSEFGSQRTTLGAWGMRGGVLYLLTIGDASVHVRFEMEGGQKIVHVEYIRSPSPSRDTIKLLSRVKDLARAHGATAIHAVVVNEKLGQLLSKLKNIIFQPAPTEVRSGPHQGMYEIPVAALAEAELLEALEEVLLEYSGDLAESEGILGEAGSSEDGKWVTIDGTHVFINKSGKITQGPKALIGKKPGSIKKGSGKAPKDASKAPADKAPADKAPADKAPADKAPADKAPADKAPADKAPADKAPADKASTSVEPMPLTAKKYEARIHERWVDNSANNVSTVLQAVVAKKYGGKVWNPRKGALQEPNEILDELLPKLEAFHSLEADRITKATENFINAQYTKTQKSLKDEGETMTLYRGTAQPKSRPGSDGNVDFDLDSLSSFTTDINIAKVYAYSVNGVVVEVQVPKKSVFGTWNSGFGEKVDFEVTVLGGSKRWKGRIV